MSLNLGADAYRSTQDFFAFLGLSSSATRFGVVALLLGAGIYVYKPDAFFYSKDGQRLARPMIYSATLDAPESALVPWEVFVLGVSLFVAMI